MEKTHENKGWIKLYRKLLDNDLLFDPNALTVFIWLLLKVNDKGQKAIGRKWASKELKMNEYTFYDALHRLVRHEAIILTTSKTTIKFTTVTIRNWHIYQGDHRLDHNPTTIKPHTIRIENIEKIPFNTNKTRELKEKAHTLIGKHI